MGRKQLKHTSLCDFSHIFVTYVSFFEFVKGIVNENDYFIDINYH